MQILVHARLHTSSNVASLRYSKLGRTLTVKLLCFSIGHSSLGTIICGTSKEFVNDWRARLVSQPVEDTIATMVEFNIVQAEDTRKR